MKIFFKPFSLIFALTLLLTTVSGCSNDEPAPVIPPPEVKRSVLVYMLADNSLGSLGYDAADLSEMLLAAGEGDLCGNRLLVYRDSRTTDHPVLLEITPEGTTTLKEYDHETSSVSVDRMRQVINDFKQLAPASNHGLILWSHATGWIENGIPQTGVVSPQSFGDDKGYTMNITDLAHALQDSAPWDYLYFDCCFMANIEALYQLRNIAPVIVGSPTELASEGMPYHLTLKYLMANEADVAAAAATTFDYFDNKTGYNRSCTMSVVDTGALTELAEATRAIYAAGECPGPEYAPQHYMVSHCYLCDMADYINSFTGVDDLLTKWNEIYGRVVIFNRATPKMWNSLSLDRANGLSTYIMRDASDAYNYNYLRLDWWNDVAMARFEPGQ